MNKTFPFLVGGAGGEMAQRMRAFDWNASPVGPPATWPQSLRTAVATMLECQLPMYIAWGPQFTQFYNDAYKPILGAKEADALGGPAPRTWDEVWPTIGPMWQEVLAGKAIGFDDFKLTIQRFGYPGDCHFSFSYSPVRDDAGRVAGVLVTFAETTKRVASERRLRFLDDLAQAARGLEDPAEVMLLTASLLGRYLGVNRCAYARVLEDQDTFDLIGDYNDGVPSIVGQYRFTDFGQRMHELMLAGEPYVNHDVDTDPVTASTDLQAYRLAGIQAVICVPLHKHGHFVAAMAVHQSVPRVWKPEEIELVRTVGDRCWEALERLRAEAALRAQAASLAELNRTLQESETRFRTFAQAMPHHVWSADADGQLDWFNDKVYAYSGARPGELDGLGWTSLVHPDDLPAAQASWARSLASGADYEVEFRLKASGGAYRWHIARARGMRDDQGRVLRWIGTNTDIEDQKVTSRALHELNLTLEQQVAERTADRDRMWRLSTDVMLVADFSATITSVNPAWTSLLGWPESDLLGKSFLDLVHPDDIASTLAEVGKLGQGVTTFKFENRYRRKDGTYVHLSWTAVPDAHFIHAVGRDVTADREAAQALRQTQAALLQAQKMESVGQLTGGVAHDFNNLLQVIAGNLQLMAQDVAGNKVAERRLSNALAAVGRGAKLASQLLAFARRQPLAPKVVNIGRHLLGLEDMLRRSLGESIEIETVLQEGLWNTFVDLAQIENAVLNLAINARDAMGGVGKLTIEAGNAQIDEPYAATHSDLQPGDYVMVAVSDTGSGMPPDVLSRAFEPFYSTKPEGKGTGLGLSMVYGFAKQSGGHVMMYSELGVGTTVKLYLPRTGRPEDAIEAADSRPAVGGNETILVAEDDEQVRKTVVDMLEALGYRVLRAPDAATALTIIESGVTVDLLFTDVVMPGSLRSTDLARRAAQLLPGIGVLFTSGYTRDAIVHGGRLDDGIELLSKPYRQEDLARKLRHVLANRRHRGLAQAGPGAGHGNRAHARAPGCRVLLVDDDDDLREMTAEILEASGHVVMQAAGVQAAMTALRERDDIQVLMTDISLRDGSGEILAREARRLRPMLPVMFASGYSPGETLPNSVALLKPFGTEALHAALEGLLDSQH